MKCNLSRPGFELVSPCSFPTTITITPRAPLHINVHHSIGPSAWAITASGREQFFFFVADTTSGHWISGVARTLHGITLLTVNCRGALALAWFTPTKVNPGWDLGYSLVTCRTSKNITFSLRKLFVAFRYNLTLIPGSAPSYQAKKFAPR